MPDASVVDRRAPILLAIHYCEDRSWAFLSGGAFDPAEGRVIGMGEAVASDDTIRAIADLPPGWTATRVRVGGEWVAPETISRFARSRRSVRA